MQEADLVAKMLRAVLQSHKFGVPFSRLQGEYKSLTGDWIPFEQLGYPTLEGYLKNIPGVVRIEIGRTGEVRNLYFINGVCLVGYICEHHKS